MTIFCSLGESSICVHFEHLEQHNGYHSWRTESCFEIMPWSYGIGREEESKTGGKKKITKYIRIKSGHKEMHRYPVIVNLHVTGVMPPSSLYCYR